MVRFTEFLLTSSAFSGFFFKNTKRFADRVICKTDCYHNLKTFFNIKINLRSSWLGSVFSYINVEYISEIESSTKSNIQHYKRDWQIHMGENQYILSGLLCVKCLQSRSSVSSTLGKISYIIFKVDTLPLSQKCIENLISHRRLAVRIFQISLDLIQLNEILMGLTNINDSDHWSITSWFANIRSGKNYLLCPEKFVGNILKLTFLNRTTQFNNFLSLLNSLPYYSPYKNTSQFQRKEKKHFGRGRKNYSSTTNTIQGECFWEMLITELGT